MRHYYPSDEPSTERLLLISPEPVSHGYGHIRATVVRRALHDITFGDGRKQYNDGHAAIGYRNAGWSGGNKTALYVESFCVRCQMNTEKDRGSDTQVYRSGQPYGSKVCFMDTYQLEAMEAKHIANTLTKIEAKMAKLEKDWGHTDTDNFANYVERVAKVLGITRFIVSTGRGNNLGIEGDYREFGAEKLESEVKAIIAKIHGRQLQAA